MKGGFPFSLSGGAEEPRPLTWIRNHSNYMAVRGMFDYIRAFSVLLRGIAINFLIFVPFLLVISLLVAVSESLVKPPAFIVTKSLLYGLAAWILLFPFLIPLFRIVSYRKSVATGSDSSVKQRDWYERSFGALLLAIIIVAAFESLPLLLKGFHLQLEQFEFGWPALTSIAAVASVILGLAPQLLSVLKGVSKAFAIAVIGLLGLLVPLFFILFVADFLVYGQPRDLTLWLERAGRIFPFGIMGAVFLGALLGVFRRKDIVSIMLLLLGSVGLLYLGKIADQRVLKCCISGEGSLVVREKALARFANHPDDLKNLFETAAFQPTLLNSEMETLELFRIELAERRYFFSRMRELLPDTTPAEIGEILENEYRPYRARMVNFFDLEAKPDSSIEILKEDFLRALLRESGNHVYGIEKSSRLVRLIDEIDFHRSDLAKDARMKEAIDLYLMIAEISDPKDLPAYESLTQKFATLFPGPEQSGSPEVMYAEKLGNLTNMGFNVEQLFPFIKLSDEINRYAEPCQEKLGEIVEEIDRLIERGSILQSLQGAKSPNILASSIINLSPEELRVLRGGHNEYTNLSKLEAFKKAEEWLVDSSGLFAQIQDELTSLAALSSRTAFYHTEEAQSLREINLWPKLIFVALLALQIWFLCWLTVDINLTSIHGLYRDRLAEAFLVGENTKGDIDVEKDLNLMEICNHDAGSIAPYHLINVALNLQGSKAMDIRDRKCDFFIFSKRFIGGDRTGYCTSENMERVFPQMDLATAMAISAAAAAPNMGRGTNPLLVGFMTLLNIRLGFWVPNPGLLENWCSGTMGRQPAQEREPAGLSFSQVFLEELSEVQARWRQSMYQSRSERKLIVDDKKQSILEPRLGHELVGIACSGGGIRSATINLGITQALDAKGVFAHCDYISTVSGGGYLGSSISTLMRETDTTGVAAISNRPVAEEKDVETDISVGQIFRWRVRPHALLREISGRLNEKSRLVNVSDGGHIENLAGIELIRRRCKYIIIGDGEADHDHFFNGLATLIQTARIDLRVEIRINVDQIRKDEQGLCQSHWAIGSIDYPGEKEPGFLLYLKSSFTGDEDEVIKRYRSKNPTFPHQSTADQFFDEGQFEVYRSLGQHIGEKVLGLDNGCAEHKGEANRKNTDKMSFADLKEWFKALDEMSVPHGEKNA